MGDDLLGSWNENHKHNLSGNIIRILNIYLAPKYDYCITKSKNLSVQLKHENKIVIPNGVSLEVFSIIEKKECREILQLDMNKRFILFAANPNRNEKNFKLAKEAFHEISDGSMELLTIFDKNQNLLNLYYNAVDCLLLTSLHEGSPNVVKEAMAVNLPIVSTDVGDVKEIASGIPGCWVTEPDKNQIKSALIQALEFDGRTNGRKLIVKRGLDDHSIAMKILNCYKEVIE